RPLAGRTGWRRQSHDTVNWTGAVEGARAAWSWRVDADRLTSDGYDLHPETPGLTRPGFTAHTASSRLEWNPDNRWEASLNARIADESQVNRIGFDQDGQSFLFDQDGSRTDWSVAPEIRRAFRPGHSLTGRGYVAQYRTRSELTTGVTETGSPETTTSHFRQELSKTEIQHDVIIGQWLILNSGVGAQREGVEADRIAGTSRSSRTAWAFSQQQFLLGSRWQITTSLRWDQHTDYGQQLSPKAALMVKARNSVRLRASVGTGFKAPTFQQLYMDYTNPVAGYSVIGSTNALQLLERMQENGQIGVVLTDLAAFPEVAPESSVSFQFSSDTDLGRHLHAHLGLFRNHVRDLIETQPVAIKSNGQQVFSYVNLSRILTQGFNAELRWRPSPSWETSLGYQWLETQDRDVMEAIDAGTLYGRRDGRDYRVTRSDYGGLFGRSRHSGTFQLAWNPAEAATRINLRGTWRSRAGYGDRNGNLVLDADEEYLPAFMLWNATASRSLSDRIVLQTGVINLFGFTHPDRIPSLSGRQFFLSVNLSSF
ncbi:MAG: TonB-dependent receptor, partial [Bacteroidetes bacterium]|nr:TonB-dependent receptor [Bacteroidota bacterium]